MEPTIKAARTLSKTVTAASVGTLDAAYAAAVQALGEAQLVETLFQYDNGVWTICIIYIPG